MFLLAGVPKLMGNPQMVAVFAAIGIGQWFRFLTGSLEVIGGVALLIPGVAVFAALLLTAVMVGAVITHVFVIGGNPAPAIALLAGMLIVVWGRKEQIRKRSR
jgi:uncharacterized membrane protein YphA (DoxX/SURF4 family)